MSDFQSGRREFDPRSLLHFAAVRQMNSLFASLWQTILKWAFSFLGGTGSPDSATAPDPAVGLAKREAEVEGAVAQAEAQAPRTDEQLEVRLRDGSF